MEISERDLRLLADAVDEQHRDGMASMQTDIAELHAETRRFRADNPGDRRDFLRKATVGAGALVVGSSVLTMAGLLPAGAQTLDDGDIAAFAESVELAAVEAYKAAAGTGKLQAAVVDVGTMFAGHHGEHAKAFGGAAGAKATGKPNPKLLEAVGGQLSGAQDQAAILKIAFDLENAAAATYLFALGALKTPAALKLTASILPVESQHAVVLGSAMGKSLSDVVPSFQTQTGAVDPTKFPVASK